MWLPDDVLDHVREVADAPDLSATKYRMVGPLGRGGMGAVYAVVDEALGREVALKVSFAPAWSTETTERVRREARILARLEHPGIVPVHDVGTLPDGRVYYVMKRVRGERLDAWAKVNLDVRAQLRLFMRICEAVALAHAEGIVHRDLKPENVMVGAFGEALVMDWGVAKELDDAEPDGAVLGTRAYMAPEQARGEASRTGAWSDVYSLGAVLKFLLAAPAPPPLASICRKAMEPTPEARYPSAVALADDVRRFTDGEPVHAHREGVGERLARFAAKNAVVLSLLAAYLLLRVLLVAFSR